MPPSGMLIIPGVRAEITFYKGLLDKLGLQFDALQMGKYKGAAEPLHAQRNEQAAAGKLRGAGRRHLRRPGGHDRRRPATERLPSQDAVGPGPVHRRGRQEGRADRRRALRRSASGRHQEALKAKDVEIVTDYKKKQIDTDFSGISGMMKLLELFMGGKPSEAAGKKPKIAVVYAVGPIMEGKSRSDFFGDDGHGFHHDRRRLASKAADDAKVAAIVLRIDSPGGSAMASDLIWRETVRVQASRLSPA